jgi:hypothetical protein
MPNVDANFVSEVLRHDDAAVIAANRQHAIFLGVRLAYQSAGYAAGTVLAKNTTDGLHYPYDDNGSSGLNTADCVLEQAVRATDFPGTGATIASSALAPAIWGGGVVMYYDRLVGIDANGVTDLGGRRVTDVSGVNLMIFG